MSRPVQFNKEQLLLHTVGLICAGGSAFATRERLKKLMRCSDGTISQAFGGMKNLHKLAWAEIVRTQQIRGIAWGLCEREPTCRAAPLELKQKAVLEILK